MNIRTTKRSMPQGRVLLAPAVETPSPVAPRMPPIGAGWDLSDLFDPDEFDPDGFDRDEVNLPTATWALSGLSSAMPAGSIAVDFLEGIDKIEAGDGAGAIAKAADLFERLDPNSEELTIPLRMISSATTLATASAAHQFAAGASLIVHGSTYFDNASADGSMALAGQIGAGAGVLKGGAKLYIEWNDGQWNLDDLNVAISFVGNVGGFLASVGIATNTFTTVSQVASGITKVIDAST